MVSYDEIQCTNPIVSLDIRLIEKYIPHDIFSFGHTSHPLRAIARHG